ncbi:SDR family NAD(P)-dependent oxidoreductase [Amycolatopsis cihanbeyliensis]|uniref:Acyl transferase domain-containing protein n=1 Tax=Amycolatopsis cihanbeyliensis TaxID=1128664 RepID=A0A542DJF8_AMYCI|nr:SDR family NAD(P)-dependent oxidoreductase [Amycolatopsis cihanbeyliensis]TQJ03210.1 acyl transferase domain-containing protein [Amycolatopsis cihanbeyliensis]WCB87229.1 EfrAIV [Amycolatopsis cihanbeyliensis]
MTDAGPQVVVLSAAGPAPLDRYVERVLEWLAEHPEADLRRVAYTLQVGREALRERLAVVARSVAELRQRLAEGAVPRGTAGTDAENIENAEGAEITDPAEREPEELARLWVRGARVDWRALHPAPRPARLSLPTAPFDTKRFWVSEPARPVAPVAHPLAAQGVQSGRREYAVTLTGQEFFLRDHAIGELKVLPAVVALELATATATRAGYGTVRGIGNVLWSRPVIVAADPVDVRLRLASTPDGMSYELRSGTGPDGELCSAGTLLFGEPDEADLAEVVDIAAIRQRCQQALTDRECYELFDRLGGGYGPSFQPIGSVLRGDREVLARLEVPASVELPAETFTLHPSLLDGMLQAALWTAADPAGDGMRRLPFALTALEIVRPLPRRAWVHAVPSEVDTGARAGKAHGHELTLLDDDGRVLLRMRGLMTRAVHGEHALNPGSGAANPRTVAFGQVWHPAPLPERAEGTRDTVVLLGTDPRLAAELDPAELYTVRPAATASGSGRDRRLRPDAEEDWRELFAELHAAGRDPITLVWDGTSTTGTGPLEAAVRRLATVFRGWSGAAEGATRRPVRLLWLSPRRETLDDALEAALDGMAKAIANEQPDFRVSVVGVPDTASGELSALLAAELAAPEHEFAVSHDTGGRRVPRWEPVESFDRDGLGPALRDGGTYLVTGGLGGIGQLLVAHLATKGRARFVLSGRSSNVDVQPRLHALRRQGIDVEYLPAALGERGAAEDLVRRVRESHGALHGVLHLAGVTRDGFLLTKADSELAEVLAPKVRGTVELDRATADEPLDFFILFSSMSGAAGSPGQADYAYANRFLDHFAAWREARRLEGRRSGHTLSLLWSLWAEGGIRMDMDDAAQARMVRRAGLRALPTSAGLAAFDAAVSSGRDHVLIAQGEQGKVAELLANTAAGPRAPEPAAETAPGPAPRPIRSADPARAAEEYLRPVLAEVFGMTVEEIEPEVAFESYGIDSILIMDMTRQLEEHFGPLPKTLFFEYQDLRSLAGYFAERYPDTVTAAEAETRPVPEPESEPAPQAGPDPEPAPPARTEPAAGAGDTEPIAIIGVSVRFAESDTLDEFWANLSAGRDLITEIPPERWDWRDYEDATPADQSAAYSRWGSFLDGVETFDPLFFGISPREAEIIDPQERLFLQTTWHAMEDAGYTRQALQQLRAGVYVGAMYTLYQLYEGQDGRIAASSYAAISNRVSYTLGLSGPSVAVDTMCSSALSAIHLAIKDLRSGDAELAIAGGVNLHVHPYKYRFLGQGQFTSSDGRCRSFGEGGDGYVPGEGVGAVLLKPLSAALRDGDHVHATILGSSINHGGKTNGFTVPNPVAQGDLIGQAAESAGVDLGSLSYVEAHGTGTSLGDPVEIRGLTRAFAGTGLPEGGLPIGSVKSNLGHLESAAGMAALAKVLVQLEHRTLVPSLHAETPNPNIDWTGSPFAVQRESAPWRAEGSLRAGISSFGAGGANAHLIVEEYRAEPRGRAAAAAERVFPFSAKTAERLRVLAGTFAEALDGAEADPADVAHTLRAGREPLPERLAVVADSLPALVARLREFARTGEPGEHGWTGTVSGRARRGGERPAPGTSPAELARAWTEGSTVDWPEERAARRIPLPGYPFERMRCWITDEATLWRPAPAPQPGGAVRTHPLLGAIDPAGSVAGGLAFAPELDPAHPVLADHRIGGSTLLPGVAVLELARAAAVAAGMGERLVLRDVRWLRPLTGTEPAVRLRLHQEEDRGLRFSLLGTDTTFAEGRIEALAETADERIDLGRPAGEYPHRQEGQRLYADLAAAGSEYGPALRGLEWVAFGEGGALALLRTPEIPELAGCVLAPALLDGALHTFGVLRDRESAAMVPFAVAAVEVRHTPGAVGYARVRPSGADRYQIDLADEGGRICVRLRDVALRPAGGAGTPAPAPVEPVERSERAELDGLLFAPRWRPVPTPDPAGERQGPVWIVAAEPEGELARAVAAEIGGGPLIVSPEQAGSLEGVPGSVFFLGTPAPARRADDPDALETGQRRGVLALFGLVKNLLAAGASARPVRLTVVTEDACAVTGEPVRDPFAASLHGLTLSLAQEYPRWRVGLLDLTAGTEPGRAARLVTGGGDTGGPLALRGGTLYRRDLVPAAAAEDGARARVRSGGSYLILGGAGGIGLELTAWLVGTFGASVVLVGRGELGEDRRQRLREIDPEGRFVRYERADAGDPAALREVVRRITERGPLHGVVHSTIVLHDQSLARMDEATFRSALEAKTRVSVALHAATGSLPLDFVLFFSSAVALSGSAGQSNYAAGSTFEDAFAHFLDEHSTATVRVVNWGYWGTVGVVARDHYRERLARQGIYSLDPAEGMAAIERVLAGGQRQLVVTKASRQVLESAGVDFTAAGEAAEPPVFAELAEPAGLPPVPRLLTEADGSRLERIMLDWLWRMLTEQGVFTAAGQRWTTGALAERLGVLPKYRRLLAELLRMLTLRGYLAETGGDEREAVAGQVTGDPEAELVELCANTPALNRFDRLLRPCLHKLFEVMSGRVRATEVMFPGGSTELVEGAYQGSPVVDRANHLVSSAVRSRVERDTGSGQVSIVEIGAGTGGTTAGVLPEIAGFAPDLRYVYTDISGAFLQHGRAQFAERHPYLEFRTLDIGSDPEPQGFPAGGFDVVIAANVLHATGDLLATLGNVGSLLREGGWLVLNEATANVLTATLTFGLLDGWWLNTDEHLRLPGSPLLSGDGWRQALRRAGFGRVLPVPADEDGTQHLVVAEWGTPASAARTAPATPPVEAESLREAVFGYVRGAFREVLQVPEDRLSAGETYENFGVDSLTSARVIDLLSAEVGSLPATLLFEYPTIGELVDFLLEQHADALRAALLPDRQRAPEAPEPVAAATAPPAEPARRPEPAVAEAPPGTTAERDGIAVVGMAGRYPMAADVEQFWANLRAGKECVTEVPADRWDRHSMPEVDGTPVSGWGGFLDGIDEFDPRFFQMSLREAEFTDPQERLLLQTAWHTLEDAGYPRARLRPHAVGVYVGVMYGHYQLFETEDGLAGGMGYASIANRLSYFFDFTGPSLAVDTMCSSSLSAIHLACEALRHGQVDYALAGGVNLTPHPRKYVQLATGGFTSTDGRCRSFGAGGDGMVPGEGVGALLLKPLALAERDGDRILGVIRGGALNHGGKTGGFAVPNPNAQGELIRTALRDAGTDPASISYLEAHGTGTALGDPTEMAGLVRAFGDRRADARPIALGSVKSNLGHLESAAGVAAVTKVLLQLRHRELVPSLHAETLNPKIDWDSVPLRVQRERAPWSAPGPLRAGVSAFGAGGANAHLVLEEYPREAGAAPAGAARRVFVLSARDRDRLRELVTAVDGVLAGAGTGEAPAVDVAELAARAGVPGAGPEESLADLGLDLTAILRLLRDLGAERVRPGQVHEGMTLRALAELLGGTAPTESTVDLERLAYTLQAGREAMGERLAVVAGTAAELRAGLRRFLDGRSAPEVHTGSVRAESWPSSRQAHPGDGDPHRLAAEWVSGTEFDWDALYPARPRPMSLPGYPFARTRCWIDARAEVATAGRPAPAPGADVPADLAERVLGVLSAVTGYPPGELDPEATFHEHGLDSLSLVKFADRLGTELGTTLSPDELLAAPTVTALTERLCREHGGALAAAAPRPAPEPKREPEPADDPVVIVGMAGMLPGSPDLATFWEHCERGDDLISQVPPQRWDWREAYGDPAEHAGRTRITRAGFMPGIDRFDPLFFGISPREARWMDPRQRLLLQAVWSAIEDSGFDPHDLAGTRTGLFFGTGASEYAELIERSGVTVDAYASTGLTPSMLANRISYQLDLRGPSEPVDTACSSSLVALHRAVEAIEVGHCDTVITGGVSALLSPVSFAALERAGMLSPEGVGRAFGAGANGYVRGEGVGAVVLKRLSAALADGNPVHAVVRGTAVNHGGRANSLTAPNPNAQAEVIVRAYAKAGVDPATVGFVETHGTGTVIGDPAEITGLRQAFGELLAGRDGGVPDGPWCALGAVKNLVGHLEPAAGVAALLRALLAMRHGRIPELSNVDELNEYLRLDGSPFYVPRQGLDWARPRDERGRELPRRAGISSFGYGGVNAHVLLEEYRSGPDTGNTAEPVVFTLSARDEERLAEYARAFLATEREWAGDLTATAYTLQRGRADLPARLAFVAETGEQAVRMLRGYLAGDTAGDAAGVHTGLVARGAEPPELGSADYRDPDRLAAAWVAGARVDWPVPHAGRRRSLPTYPFAPERHWFATAATEPATEPAAEQQAVTWFAAEWEPAEPVRARGPLAEPVLVFTAGDYPLAEISGHPVPVHPGTGFRELPGDAFEIDPGEHEDYARLLTVLRQRGIRVDRVAHLWSLDAAGPDLPAHGPESGFLLLKALLSTGTPMPRVLHVGVPDSSPFAEAWGGFTGSLRAIAPETTCSVLRAGEGTGARELAAALTAEPDATMTRHRDGQRSVRRLREFTPAESPGSGARLRDGGVYLISGGMGGLGLLLARALAPRGAKLALLGRSPLDEARRAELDRLRALGAQAEYWAADAADPAAAIGVVQEVLARWGTLHGVFHLAGTVSREPLPGKELDELRRQLRPRVAGPHALDEATRDLPLELFVLYSSIAGQLGDYGLVDYGVGARYLDGFAEWRERLRGEGRRGGHTVAIDWPMWREGGMHVDADDERRYLDSTGFRYLDADAGLRVLELALRTGRTQVMVLPGEPDRMRALVAAAEEVGRQRPRPERAPRAAAPEPAPAGGDLEAVAARELRRVLAGILDLAESTLDAEAGFGEYGLDSFGLKTLSVELGERYGIDVPTTALFGANTIGKLAAHLAGEYATELNRVHTPAAPRSGEPGPEPAPAARPARSEPAAEAETEPIAVIGMSGRFPGSPDLDAFWHNLAAERDLITETPPGRWDWRELAERFEGTARWGGFLDEIDRFDPLFFKISPLEAEVMDPQHRLFLQHAWHALEDAGQRADLLAGRAVSVFVGTQFADYETMVLAGGRPNAYAGTGLARTMLANRLSYLLDLRGPSESIDTACSSSLVAVHRAVRSLRAGETELGIVGGVSLILSPQTVVAGNQLGVLSPDGRCKTLDAGADGYVKGEGVAAMVLKPLSRALADGDPVHGVIRGSAVNHGGHASSLTAPNPEAQADLLRAAYADAGVPIDSVSYVELHGTGTELGDPVEIDAIQRAHGGSAAGEPACGLGSVKSNIGHLEPAAGIAGMLKVLLAMRHGRLPATLHLRELNPHIRIEGSRFTPVRHTTDWQPTGPGGAAVPRRAGVSSFGFGGVNAHVVLEEAARPEPERTPDGPQLFVLSARDAEALRRYAGAVLEFLDTGAGADCPLTELAYTAQTGRVPMAHRLAVVAEDHQRLREGLRAFLDGDRAGRAHWVAGTPSAEAGQDWLAEPEGRDYLARLVRDRDLPRLARLWTGGADLDFTALHPVRPGRVALPTYPFARDRHWLSTPAEPERAERAERPADERLLVKRWQPAPRPAPAELPAGPVLVLAGPGTEELTAGLAGHALVVTLTEAEDADPEAGARIAAEVLDRLGEPACVLDCVDLAEPTGRVPECWARVRLAQELLGRFRTSGLRYLHLTAGLTTFRAPRPSLRGAVFAGLVRMLPAEYRAVRARTVDLDPDALTPEGLRELVAAELAAEDEHTEVCVRSGVRYLPELAAAPEAAGPAADPGWCADLAGRPVLITGGTGALGRLLAGELAGHGADRLVLLGHSPLPERAEWERLHADPGTDPELARRLGDLLALEHRGVRLRVACGRLDDPAWLRDTLAGVRAELGPIAGVVHCAGTGRMDDPAFLGKRVEQMRAVLEPKVGGLAELSAACAEDPLRFFLLYSSVSALAPALAAGMSDYAMANGFLDRFAEYQAALGHPAYRSVQWPSWRADGMPEVHTPVYRELGLRTLEPAAGLNLLHRAMAVSGQPVLAPCPVAGDGFDPARLLVRSAPAPVAGTAPEPAGGGDADPASGGEELLPRLTGLFAAQLRLDSPDPDVNFADLGVDSIMIAQLMAAAEREFGITVEPSAFLENPTLRRLAAQLDGKVPARPAEPAAEPAPATTRPAEPGTRDPVAVVGIACHFPGAPDRHAFWANLMAGRDSITEAPASRWDTGRYYSGTHAPGRTVSKWGGFLDGIEEFDPDYFRLDAAEAVYLDPLVRQFLEVTAECLAEAGYRPEEVSGRRVGVFAGARTANFGERYAGPGKGDISGLAQNFIAAQVAHFLDVRGPNLVVDSACSSALVSVHLATQSLRLGESDLALAGGVEILLDELPFVGMSESRALSPTGRCRTFAEDADGIVLGEGAGALLLKRLSDALRDGDHVHAVLEGGAVNNDGRTMGITTPNPDAQREAIHAALRDAGVTSAERIGYVEAHGTGTRIGDPMELKALTEVFRASTDQVGFCGVGSVKTNIGHLLSAAGIAGLIKTVLAVEHGQLPPTLHCETTNQRFRFADSPLFPVRAARQWSGRDGVRRAGVSSFGFGGTNAHLVVRQADPSLVGEYVPRRAPLRPIRFQRTRLWPQPPRPARPAHDSAAPEGNGATPFFELRF